MDPILHNIARRAVVIELPAARFAVTLVIGARDVKLPR
jgi:hypothetical protein